MDQLRPRKQVGWRKTVILSSRRGRVCWLKVWLGLRLTLTWLKKIRSLAFQFASLKGMECRGLTLYFNCEFSWPVTFTFVQHYSIIYQHSVFFFWPLEFRPPQCLPSRRRYRSPICEPNIVQCSLRLQASTVPSAPGERRENQAGFMFRFQRILRTQDAPSNESAVVQRGQQRRTPQNLRGDLGPHYTGSQEPYVLTPLRHECCVCEGYGKPRPGGVTEA